MSTQVADIDRLIEEQIRSATPSQRLYNPSNEVITQMVGGHIYTLPPDGYAKLEGDEREQRYDGILLVTDQWGVSPEARKKAIRQGIRSPAPDRVELTAAKVVKHLIAKLGKRGVVFLTGDPIKDKKLCDEGRSRWMAFQLEQAERTVRSYNNRTLNWHADPRNKGKFAPVMNEREIAAQELMDGYQAEKLGQYAYVCPERDGYATDDEAKFELHMRVSHPAATQTEPLNVQAPKRRGRPPKAQAEA
jgi:hypothetical protein